MNHRLHNPDKCTACGTCTVYCPVAEAAREYPGPKLIGPALERFRRLRAADDASIEYCSNCKNCDITCPSGVPVSTLNMLAKAEYHKTHKRKLRDWLLAHGELMAKLSSPTAAAANIGMANPLTRGALKKLGITADIPLPRYAAKTFVQQFRKLKQQPSADKVVFFPGCYINYNDPATGLDFVAVMQANGFEVIVPTGLKCCGSPLVAGGYLDEALGNARHNARELKKWTDQGYPVLTSCTSCGLMLKQEYQELFDLPEARDVAGHIHDAGEFLLALHDDGKLRIPFAPVPGRFLYHAPCHLRAQGIGRPSLELLALIPGCEVTDADAGCCGIAGSYGFKQEKAHIARAIGERLFQKIRDAKPDAVLSECGTCRLQIAHNTGVATRHPISILRQACVPAGPEPGGK